MDQGEDDTARGTKRGATGPAEGGNAGVWQRTEVEEVLKDGVWQIRVEKI